MVRAMCSAKLMEKKRRDAGIEGDGGHVLRKALEFEVKGKRKRGGPRKT